ncbi:hypothetical protein D3C77_258720 [compost metagenome]
MNTSLLRSNVLDPTYGNGGVAYPDPLISTIAATVPAGDGRICVGTGNGYRYALFRVDSQGNLDKNFGEKDGLTTGSFKEGFNADGRGVQVLSDGRILITGIHHTGTQTFPALARFSAKGYLDKEYGEGGHRILDQPPIAKKQSDSSTPAAALSDAIRSSTLENVQAQVQSNPHTHLADDKIYLTYNFPWSNSVIYRLDIDGNLDKSFNASGYKYLSPPLGLDTYAGPIYLEDDRILLCGSSSSPDGKTRPCVIRLNSSGEDDQTFGDGGYAFAEIESSQFSAIDKRMDGTIVCAGYTLPTPQKGLIAAFDDKGQPLHKFENSTTDFGAYGGVWTRIGALKDGTIISAGNTMGGNEADVVLGRFKSHGAPDLSFGSRGWESIALGNSIDMAFSSALQSDGKTLITGSDFEENGNLVRKGFLLRCLTKP